MFLHTHCRKHKLKTCKLYKRDKPHYIYRPRKLDKKKIKGLYDPPRNFSIQKEVWG